MSEGRILGFDGVRGLAVLCVVLTHLGAYSAFEGSRFVPMVNGRTGVQAFFVLSGFLITLLLIREFESRGRVSLRDFYIRRSLRILPLYLLLLVGVSAAWMMNPPVASGRSLAYALTYMTNFIPREDYAAILGHTWSLAVEEHFYLVWPVLFLSMYRRDRNSLLALCAGAFVLSFGLRAILATTDLGDRYFIYRWTFVAGGNIAAGCALALCLTGSQASAAWKRGFEGAGPLVFGLVLFSHTVFWPGSPEHLAVFLRAAGIALLIGWIFVNQASTAVRVLEFPPLRLVGVISYGVYIYQGFFLSTSASRAPGQTWPPDPLTGCLLLLIVAPLSYRFVERPLLRLKSRFSPPTLAPGAASPRARGEQALPDAAQPA